MNALIDAKAETRILILLKDLKETPLHHFLFVSLHQIRVKCGLAIQGQT